MAFDPRSNNIMIHQKHRFAFLVEDTRLKEWSDVESALTVSYLDHVNDKDTAHINVSSIVGYGDGWGDLLLSITKDIASMIHALMEQCVSNKEILKGVSNCLRMKDPDKMIGAVKKCVPIAIQSTYDGMSEDKNISISRLSLVNYFETLMQAYSDTNTVFTRRFLPLQQRYVAINLTQKTNKFDLSGKSIVVASIDYDF